MGDDDPSNEVFYGLMKCLYAHNPIRVNIAGTVESIAEITADTLYTCHKAFYNPGGMVLWVAGSVEAERVAEIAREILPREPVPTVETDFGPAEEPHAFQPSREKEMAVSAPLFQVGFKGTPAKQGEEQRQYLLGSLVCDVLVGPSSPLYTRLYEEGLINNSFGGNFDILPGAAYLYVGGDTNEPEKVYEAVTAEAKRLATEGVDEDFYQRIRRACYGQMIRGLNSFESIAVSAAEGVFFDYNYYDFPEVFETITKADVEDFLRRNVTAERAAISLIYPRG